MINEDENFPFLGLNHEYNSSHLPHQTSHVGDDMINSSSFTHHFGRGSNDQGDQNDNPMAFDPMEYLCFDQVDEVETELNVQHQNITNPYPSFENPAPFEIDHSLPNIHTHDQITHSKSMKDNNINQYYLDLSSLPERNPYGFFIGNNRSPFNGEIYCASNVAPAPRRNSYKKRTNTKTGRARSSSFRGVSRYHQRFEAFLWDNTEPPKKASTVYIGRYDNEEDAARAYDMVALKWWGPSAPLNFHIDDYKKEIGAITYMTKNEFLRRVKRKAKTFSSGESIYRGVSRISGGSKWQARLGKGKELKAIYLGAFDSEEEAARAYDLASIRLKGEKALTNFDLRHYNIKLILDSPTLPLGKGGSKSLMITPVTQLLLSKRIPPTHHVSDDPVDPTEPEDNDLTLASSSNESPANMDGDFAPTEFEMPLDFPDHCYYMNEGLASLGSDNYFPNFKGIENPSSDLSLSAYNGSAEVGVSGDTWQSFVQNSRYLSGFSDKYYNSELENLVDGIMNGDEYGDKE